MHHGVPYLQSLLGFSVLFLRSNAGIDVLGSLSIQLLHLRCQLWHILVAQLLAPGIRSRSQLSEQKAPITKTYLELLCMLMFCSKLVTIQKPRGPWPSFCKHAMLKDVLLDPELWDYLESPLPCRLGLQALQGI